MITLSPDQQSAVDAIAKWYRNDDQSFVVGGSAGTGKTTIMRAAMERYTGRVICATPTGKAAAVLADKLDGTGIEVGTLHSLLYKPITITELDVELQEGEIARLEDLGLSTRRAERRLARLIKKLHQGACEFGFKADADEQPLVIVDEASMVGDRIEEHLRQVARKILFVGDHAQLGPVEGKPFFSRNRPDAVLETIHRQAAGSTILRFAAHIRKGGSLASFKDWNDTDCVRVTNHDLDSLRSADQVITGKNVSRRRINRALRQGRGYAGDYPNAGERVICLRNDHARGIINGVSGTAATPCVEDEQGNLSMDVQYDDRLFEGLAIDKLAFAQYDNPMLGRRASQGGIPESGRAQFDFGHCITVHKSQGSEWDHVAVYDDKMRVQDTEARKRWMYTAATRAAKKLTWVDAG